MPGFPLPAALCEVCRCSRRRKEYLKSSQIKIVLPFRIYKLTLRCQALLVCSFRKVDAPLCHCKATVTRVAHSQFTSSSFISFKTRLFFTSPLVSVSAAFSFMLVLLRLLSFLSLPWDVELQVQVNHNSNKQKRSCKVHYTCCCFYSHSCGSLLATLCWRWSLTL